MMTKSMRTIPLALALLAGGAVAGCTTSPAPGTTPSATPSAPACPVGSWHGTGVAASTTVNGVTVTLQGGSGVRMSVAADGTLRGDFSAMQPAVYSATVGGTPVGGQLTYGGTITGTVAWTGSSTTATPLGSTPAPSTAPASTGGPSTVAPSTVAPSGSAGTAAGPGGPWTPTGAVTRDALRLTVKLTSPVAVTVVDNASIAQVTPDQVNRAGNVVDLQPLLRAGSFRCDGNDTLVITPASDTGPAVVWTFARG